ncbi:MAG: hypothetical protein HQ538_06385 [Parcubacteria group bacterium]|nr:hypothetical protein [Parcubacteria group bacterium]
MTEDRIINLIQEAKADARRDKHKRIRQVERIFNQEMQKLKEAEEKLL